MHFFISLFILILIYSMIFLKNIYNSSFNELVNLFLGYGLCRCLPFFPLGCDARSLSLLVLWLDCHVCIVALADDDWFQPQMVFTRRRKCRITRSSNLEMDFTNTYSTLTSMHRASTNLFFSFCICPNCPILSTLSN